MDTGSRKPSSEWMRFFTRIPRSDGHRSVGVSTSPKQDQNVTISRLERSLAVRVFRLVLLHLSVFGQQDSAKQHVVQQVGRILDRIRHHRFGLAAIRIRLLDSPHGT